MTCEKKFFIKGKCNMIPVKMINPETGEEKIYELDEGQIIRWGPRLECKSYELEIDTSKEFEVVLPRQIYTYFFKENGNIHLFNFKLENGVFTLIDDFEIGSKLLGFIKEYGSIELELVDELE